MSAPAVCYRIAADTRSYQADDRTGRGAQLAPGRWNREGVPMLYAASSRALACLETLVHFDDTFPFNRYLVEIRVPQDLWDAREVFDPEANVGWDAVPAGQASVDWGTEWARDHRSLIAQVPSAIVREEPNFLVDPLAPGMDRVEVRKVRRWLYDPRLPRRAS